MFEKLSQHWESKELQPILLIVASLFSCLGVYLYFWNDLSVIPRFWDGPNYMYVAKTLYNIPANHPLLDYKLTQAYFACHLPLYPLTIRFFALFFSYPMAMIMSTMLFTSLATLAFYYLILEMGLVKDPFWSAFISLFLPVRWLLYHSVGATEPLFLFLVFSSLLSFHRKKYAWAFGLAGLASITRIVGILMGLSYLIVLLRQRNWKALPLLSLIPLGLLLTFTFYHYQFGSFFAYFDWNTKLLNDTPFKILYAYAQNYKSSRPETLHSAEFYLIMYMVYGTGTLLLWRFQSVFWYCAVFFVFNSFIYHEDLSRYFIPMAPFALVVAYDSIIHTRAFKLMSVFLIAGSYIYVWQVLPHNVIVDWVYGPFIKALGGG